MGSFAANAWGLHDMHGNVWQWCEDWYDAEYVTNTLDVNRVNQTKGQFRVLRGGSWSHEPRHCRSAYRGVSPPGGRNGGSGFRVLMSSP